MTNDLSINFKLIIKDIIKFKFLSFFIIFIFLFYTSYNIYGEINKPTKFVTEIEISPITYSDNEHIGRIFYKLEKYNNKCLYLKSLIQQSIATEQKLIIEKKLVQGQVDFMSSDIYTECSSARINSIKKISPDYLIENFISVLGFDILSNRINADIKKSNDTSLITQGAYKVNMISNNVESSKDLFLVLNKSEKAFFSIISNKMNIARDDIKEKINTNISFIESMTNFDQIDIVVKNIELELNAIDNLISNLKYINIINKRIIKENVILSPKLKMINIVVKFLSSLIVAIAFSIIISLVVGSVQRSMKIEK